MDSSGAVVVPQDDPDAGFSGWGGESVSAVYRPLQIPPQIDIESEPGNLVLDDLDLDANTVDTIQERVRAKRADKALAYSNGLTRELYASLSETANVTSDSLMCFPQDVHCEWY